jgi:hypothetical protein
MVSPMSEIEKIAQYRLELEQLCDQYKRQASEIQVTLSEITLKLVALQRSGGVGMQVALEFWPQIRGIQQEFIATQKIPPLTKGAC